MTKIFAQLCTLAVLAAAVLAQGAASERGFHASKADVDTALRTLQVATGGRLPTADGFVTAQDQPLDRFQRPRYTYAIQVLPKSPTDSVVKVRARITAWYTGTTPTQSGYRELSSNGRLETDLLDRVQDLLSQKSDVTASPQQSDHASPQPTPSKTSPANPLFNTPRPGAILPPRTQITALQETRDSANYAQALREQATNLEEILRNQTHPTDLAAVRRSKTPIFSRPSEDGEVLFQAEAQDEFQILNTSSEWVHVQISGLSRGWIRGTDLELPSRPSPRPAAAPSAKSPDAGPAPKSFRLARQEVNTFPGEWAPLRGKSVRILSLEPTGATPSASAAHQQDKWEVAKEMFHRAAVRLTAPEPSPAVEGVVLIFDSADGGMASTTVASLQKWNAGSLSDEAFRAQCSLDPPEAFQK